MDPRVNIVVLGAPSTGKTALTVKFLTDRFIGEYSSRSDQSYEKIVDVEGRLVKLTILDTCKYPSVSKLHKLSLWGHGFLVVFSLTDPNSLIKALNLLHTLFSLTPRSPFLLLGNKSDLRHIRRVSTLSAMAIAVREGALYLEVSAAGPSTLTLDSAFTSVTRLAVSFSVSPRVPSCLQCFRLMSHWMGLWRRKRRKDRSSFGLLETHQSKEIS